MDKVRKWNEIWRLHEMLQEAGIEHEFSRYDDLLYPKSEFGDNPGWNIFVKNAAGDFLATVGEGVTSYGMEQDKLEMLGLVTEEELQNSECEEEGVLGWLTAENVFERIRAAVDNETT